MTTLLRTNTILDNLELIYTFQKRIEWEGTKFYYDFELHNSNILFEVHGIQHYERGFEAIGGRSLEEEKQNDLLKKNIAKKYGYRVIEIDAKKSTIKYIREELERNEELKEIIDVQAIDWDFVKRASMITRDTLMLEMLKKGEDKQKIAQKFGISQASIPEIKKRFIDDGLWDGISVGDKIKKEEEKKLIATIEEMWNEGMKSGDICKILCLSNDRFKRLMQLDVFPDPKRVEKWTDEEAEKVIKAKDLPIELVSGFIDRRTNAVWKCKHCGTFFKATLIGLETGPKCPQCKGYEKVEQHLSKNFPGEYEIRSLYSASDTYMKFLHLVCGNEFYRTPHSIKRSIIPCIVCAEKYRIIKASRQK